jgi:hypothetical protein
MNLFIPEDFVELLLKFLLKKSKIIFYNIIFISAMYLLKI